MVPGKTLTSGQHFSNLYFSLDLNLDSVFETVNNQPQPNLFKNRFCIICPSENSKASCQCELPSRNILTNSIQVKYDDCPVIVFGSL